MLGLNYSNVQYKPGVQSAFSQTATFDTVGLIGTFKVTGATSLTAGYSLTAERARNGIASPTRYSQISLEQTFNMTARTALYAIQAYQRAKGKTLRAQKTGVTIGEAVAAVGDSQNSTPSNGQSQFVAMFGIRTTF